LIEARLWLTVSYGKSPFFNAEINELSMAMFNSFVYVDQKRFGFLAFLGTHRQDLLPTLRADCHLSPGLVCIEWLEG
jgi:hypothetical protein